MKMDKQILIQHILQNIDGIYKSMGLIVPEEWLSSDMTVTQLRLLLTLHTYGPLRMSDITVKLEVALPTTTVVVDHLVHKNLVLREANPLDRRLVICKLSPEGQTLINKLWDSGRLAMEKLLESLTFEQVQKAAELAEIFNNNASKFTQTSK